MLLVLTQFGQHADIYRRHQKAIGSLRWGLPFRAKRRNGACSNGGLPKADSLIKADFFAYFFLKKVREKIFLL